MSEDWRDKMQPFDADARRPWVNDPSAEPPLPQRELRLEHRPECAVYRPDSNAHLDPRREEFICTCRIIGRHGICDYCADSAVVMSDARRSCLVHLDDLWTDTLGPIKNALKENQ